jgi:hypothetical protein
MSSVLNTSEQTSVGQIWKDTKLTATSSTLTSCQTAKIAQNLSFHGLSSVYFLGFLKSKGIQQGLAYLKLKQQLYARSEITIQFIFRG